MDTNTTMVSELWEAEMSRKMANVHGTALVQPGIKHGLTGAAKLTQPCGADHLKRGTTLDGERVGQTSTDTIRSELDYLQNFSCIGREKDEDGDDREPDTVKSNLLPQVQLLLSNASDDPFSLDLVNGCSWGDVMKAEEEKRATIGKQEEEERGRKLFVGNVTVWDLLCSKEEIAATENGQLQQHETLYEALKDSAKSEAAEKRIRFLLWIFLQYGAIERMRINLEKRFLFVVFRERSACTAASGALRSFETRCGYLEALRSYCMEHEPESLPILPLPNFYCRMPKNAAPRNLNKRRKKAKRGRR